MHSEIMIVRSVERNVFIVDITMDKLEDGDYKDNNGCFFAFRFGSLRKVNFIPWLCAQRYENFILRACLHRKFNCFAEFRVV